MLSGSVSTAVVSSTLICTLPAARPFLTLLCDPATKGLMLGLAGDLWDPALVWRPTAALIGQYWSVLGFKNLLLIAVLSLKGKLVSTVGAGEELSHPQTSDSWLCLWSTPELGTVHAHPWLQRTVWTVVSRSMYTRKALNSSGGWGCSRLPSHTLHVNRSWKTAAFWIVLRAWFKGTKRSVPHLGMATLLRSSTGWLIAEGALWKTARKTWGYLQLPLARGARLPETWLIDSERPLSFLLKSWWNSVASTVDEVVRDCSSLLFRIFTGTHTADFLPSTRIHGAKLKLLHKRNGTDQYLSLGSKN